MLTQVNAGRDPWHVLAPIKIPPWTLTSARFAAIEAAGAIDTAGCSLHVQERFCNIFLRLILRFRGLFQNRLYQK